MVFTLSNLRIGWQQEIDSGTRQTTILLISIRVSYRAFPHGILPSSDNIMVDYQIDKTISSPRTATEYWTVGFPARLGEHRTTWLRIQNLWSNAGRNDEHVLHDLPLLAWVSLSHGRTIFRSIMFTFSLSEDKNVKKIYPYVCYHSYLTLPPVM